MLDERSLTYKLSFFVYCYFYSATFNENSDMQVNVTWPSHGFTERQVRRRCQNIIVNSKYIGDTCFDNNSGGGTSSNDIVQACVNDVQVFPVFTALHAMQTRSSDENSVRLSVCPSHACIVTKR